MRVSKLRIPKLFCFLRYSASVIPIAAEIQPGAAVTGGCAKFIEQLQFSWRLRFQRLVNFRFHKFLQLTIRPSFSGVAFELRQVDFVSESLEHRSHCCDA